MKKLALAVILASIGTTVFATGTPAPVPNNHFLSTDIDLSAGAKSKSASDSQAISSSTLGSTNKADQNQSFAPSEKSSTRAGVLVFPPPVSLPAMAAINCEAEITQEAESVGWNFASKATGKTDPKVCNLLKIANMKRLQCQYKSAKMIEDQVVQYYMPEYVPTGYEGFKDYTAEECTAGQKVVPVSTPAPKPAACTPRTKDVACAKPGGVRVIDPATGTGCCVYPKKKDC